MATNWGANYYRVAHEALSGIRNHPGFNHLKKLCREERGAIVDVGCGEGSRLDYLVSGKNGLGVEINEYALGLARKNYPRFKYVLQKNGHIPIEDNIVAITFSTFVLEHATNPELFIDEMVRITKPGGKLAILCPNFGAPNRRSPNSVENPITKLIKGFLTDFSSDGDLNWTKVEPKKAYKQIDDDTTVEPYLLSLARYLRAKGLRMIIKSSLWELEQKTINPRKLLFLFLGKLGIFPFNCWGPQIFLVARK